MPEVVRPDGTRIRYEVLGGRPSVLALAPGVVNSEIAAWQGDPLLAALQEQWGVVVMDQRYAGASTGPNYPFAYGEMTGDQLAVADAAGMDRFIVVGRQIGANYALRLASSTPNRVNAAIVLEPLGRPHGAPRSAGYGMFAETCRLARADGLRAVIAAAKEEPRFDRNNAGGPYAARLAADDAFVEQTLDKGRERYVVRVVRFRDAMFPGDTPLFSVTADKLAACSVPIAVVPGESELAPKPIGLDLLALAPRATLLGADLASSLAFVEGAFQQR
jgi:pimeloyl-ACP methyl ester carboxylesterase